MKKNTLSDIEIKQLRNDTPGCENKIHFNNAGASLPPEVVVNTIVQYLREEALLGGYETEYQNSERIEHVYRLIAQLINAKKEEIAIFENASAAWLTAFNGLHFNKGDEIIISELEYTSNLLAFINVKYHGVKVIAINNRDDGSFPFSDLESSISERTKLIAVTHIPSSGGGMLPIEAIGTIAKKHGVRYMVDACQTAGQFPIDVKVIGCDILSATGRKYLRAPRGTGFLYVKREIQDHINTHLLDQHSISSMSLDEFTLRPDARRFELYEKSRALTLGLGKAVEYALEIGIERIWERIHGLASFTRKQLSMIPGITVLDVGEQQCGIVTFLSDQMDSKELRDALGNQGINVSFGGPNATLIYMKKKGVDSLVRASLHYYNTEDEIFRMCTSLKKILAAQMR